jgi:hypothetical protein
LLVELLFLSTKQMNQVHKFLEKFSARGESRKSGGSPYFSECASIDASFSPAVAPELLFQPLRQTVRRLPDSK